MSSILSNDRTSSTRQDVVCFYLNAFYCGECGNGVMKCSARIARRGALTDGEHVDFGPER
jgi:hypothetical protein